MKRRALIFIGEWAPVVGAFSATILAVSGETRVFPFLTPERLIGIALLAIIINVEYVYVRLSKNR